MEGMIAFIVGGGSAWRTEGTLPQTGLLSWRHTGQCLPAGAVPVAALLDGGHFVCLHVPEGAFLVDRGNCFETEEDLGAGFLHHYLDTRRVGAFTRMADMPTLGGLLPSAVYWYREERRWFAVSQTASRGRTTPRRAVARLRAEQVGAELQEVS